MHNGVLRSITIDDNIPLFNKKIWTINHWK